MQLFQPSAFVNMLSDPSMTLDNCKNTILFSCRLFNYIQTGFIMFRWPSLLIKVEHDSLSGKKCGNLKKHIHELKLFHVYSSGQDLIPKTISCNIHACIPRICHVQKIPLLLLDQASNNRTIFRTQLILSLHACMLQKTVFCITYSSEL